MPVRDTSKRAYKQIQPLGLAQQIVYDVIEKLGCPTDMEITKNLGYADPNKVRPRRKELLDMGFITECEKRICSITKRTVWSWRVK